MANWTLKEKSVGDLTVTLEGDKWQSAVEKAFKKLAANLTLKGFRKGKAPRALAEKNITPEERYYEAVRMQGDTWFKEALDELKLNPIAQAQLDIPSISSDGATLVFTFPVFPEVKIDGYKGLKYDAEEVSVSDDELKAEVEKLQKQYADEIDADEAKDGDKVTIDYEGFKDGVAFDGGKGENYPLVLGSHSFIPGFEEALVGSKKGEEKEISLTFPEDYHVEDLKGAPVVFKVAVKEIKHKVLPELDDDFAKDVNFKDVSTMEELRTFLKDRLEKQKKDEAESKADENLMDQVITHLEADIPDVMIESEVYQNIRQLEAQISGYGISLEYYLQMMNKTLDDLKKDYTETSTRNVKIRLSLGKIATNESLEASEEDIEKEIVRLGEQYGLSADKVREQLDEAVVKEDVLCQKAFDFVKENCVKD